MALTLPAGGDPLAGPFTVLGVLAVSAAVALGSG